jgi:hypothetical protein
MAIFTRQFTSADDYEEWLEHASNRINVLSIDNPPALFGSTMQRPSGPVVVKFQTHDKSFAPPRRASGKAVEYVIVGAAFFALFAYMIAEL